MLLRLGLPARFLEEPRHVEVSDRKAGLRGEGSRVERFSIGETALDGGCRSELGERRGMVRVERNRLGPLLRCRTESSGVTQCGPEIEARYCRASIRVDGCLEQREVR